MLRMLQPTGKLRQGAYRCPLCHRIHLAGRRMLAFYRRYMPSDLPGQDAVASNGGASDSHLQDTLS